MSDTEPTATISLIGDKMDAVRASQFDVENGWVILRAANGQTVAAYPEERVNSVKFE